MTHIWLVSAAINKKEKDKSNLYGKTNESMSVKPFKDSLMMIIMHGKSEYVMTKIMDET